MELKKMSKWAVRAEKILKRIPAMPKIKIPKIGLSIKRRSR